MYHVLALADLVPGVEDLVIRIIDTHTSESFPEQRKDDPVTTWVLGACLSCLSQRPPSDWSTKASMIAWLEHIVKHHHLVSNGFVLDGLVKLIRAEGS